MDPAVTRSVWVTDADLRGVVTDPGCDHRRSGDRRPGVRQRMRPERGPGADRTGPRGHAHQSSAPGDDSGRDEANIAGGHDTRADRPEGHSRSSTDAPSLSDARPRRDARSDESDDPGDAVHGPGNATDTHDRDDFSRKVIVPDLRGSSSADAVQRLTDLGLDGQGPRRGPEVPRPPHRLRRDQLPDPGTTVDPGSIVTIGVGHQGPAVVPDVLAFSYDDADQDDRVGRAKGARDRSERRGNRSGDRPRSRRRVVPAGGKHCGDHRRHGGVEHNRRQRRSRLSLRPLPTRTGSRSTRRARAVRGRRARRLDRAPRGSVPIRGGGAPPPSA